jgi:hypothetical protein
MRGFGLELAGRAGARLSIVVRSSTILRLLVGLPELCTQRWGALQHITADPGRITQITRAAFVLTQFEHKYIS